jgi:hypothetical protein
MSEEKTINFKIESIDDLRRIIQIAKGGNPDAQQFIEKVFGVTTNTETAFFSDKKIMIAVAQQNGFADTHFSNDEFNPFRMIARNIENATKGFKGNKVTNIVNMLRQSPNLADLEGASEEVKSGFLQGILGRGKE